MNLTADQSKMIYAKFGIWVLQVCDKCRTAIGPFNRFTRSENDGVWCSRKCRDGVERKEVGLCQGCGNPLTGKRKGTLYCSNTCRMRFASNQKVLKGRKLDANATDSKAHAARI